MLLLHSFEIADSREEFQAASKLEPRFCHGLLGRSAHLHASGVGRAGRPAARAALQRLAPTAEGRSAKAPTRREKDYLQAVEVLYSAATRSPAILAYSDAWAG